jgi:hypothetical protein
MPTKTKPGAAPKEATHSDLGLLKRVEGCAQRTVEEQEGRIDKTTDRNGATVYEATTINPVSLLSNWAADSVTVTPPKNGGETISVTIDAMNVDPMGHIIGSFVRPLGIDIDATALGTQELKVTGKGEVRVEREHLNTPPTNAQQTVDKTAAKMATKFRSCMAGPPKP